VLGIDAAWTERHPSGVAVAVERAGRWHLAAVAPSYDLFLAHARREPQTGARPTGSIPDPVALLRAAEALAGCAVDLVAIDMPLARSPISRRRESDNAVSRAYGRRKCGTHTPSAVRPGPLSDALRAGFERAGYPLLTDASRSPGLVEVYPHPALVELASVEMRLPYKIAKASAYWPDLARPERIRRISNQWQMIVGLLDTEIAGVAARLPPLPEDAAGFALKAYEDMIDAVVCAWVGVAVLERRATAYGDADSAIWVPDRP
jgi:predicted RNase H-like nuclease